MLQAMEGKIEMILKKCNCCKREFTRDEWLDLPYVGLQDCAGYYLELRNCHCHSTIAVGVSIYNKYMSDRAIEIFEANDRTIMDHKRPENPTQ